MSLFINELTYDGGISRQSVNPKIKFRVVDNSILFLLYGTGMILFIAIDWLITV